MRILSVVFLTCLYILAHVAPTRADERLPIGIVSERPTKGRFVKVDRGFMVAYTATIPGTKVTFEMAPVPAGSFQMGSPHSERGRDKSEGPQRKVNVEPYWIGKHEVTWGEYRQYMALYEVFKDFERQKIRLVTPENKLDAVTAPTEIYDPSAVFMSGKDDRLPAVMMTQFAAKQYTKWLSKLTDVEYRLPSEAEWEYACRAGTKTRYSFGADSKQLDEYAWYLNNADDRAQKVGLKKPNAWGLHDMHGNVWEWVADAYSADAYAKRVDGADAMTSVVWPSELSPLTVRGGSWADFAKDCRSTSHVGSNDRDWKDQDAEAPKSPWWYTTHPADAVGFRVVRSVVPLTKEQRRRFWDSTIRSLDIDLENRLIEGRGAIGLVDEDLPRAMKTIDE